MKLIDRTTAQDFNHVEQQRKLPDGPKIVNPTTCAWDADDEIWVLASGYLKGGESYTITECLIEDWTDHLIALIATVKARQADALTVNVHFVRRGQIIYEGEAKARDKRYSELRICTKSHDYDRQDTSGEVVGEGYGWPTDIEYTVTNNGRKRVQVSLRAVIAGDSSAGHARWCR